VNDVYQFVAKPENIAAFLAALIGGILVVPTARLLRAALLFIPKRIEAAVGDMVKFAPILVKAHEDALSAAAYAGVQLGSLILNCWLATIFLAIAYFVSAASSGLLATYRAPLLVVVVLALLVFLFHVVKRMVLLRILYTMVLHLPAGSVKPPVPDPAKPPTEK
jgi:hypothetical protein